MRIIDADRCLENVKTVESEDEKTVITLDAAKELARKAIDDTPTIPAGEISDGYHTFDDLYEQRLILSAALAKNNPKAWKSKLHEDLEKPFGGGWFIVGFTTREGEYRYHYELKYWDLFKCKELAWAPRWDGHTSKDVRRLLSM